MTLFIALFLILFGSQLILQALFGISIPLLRIGIGCLIIYWGLMMLYGRWNVWTWQKSYTYITTSNTNTRDSHSTFFSTQHIDLSDIDYTQHQTHTINTVFGTSIVTLNKDIPTRINADAVFGSITLPNGFKIKNTSEIYYTHGKSYKPVLILNANTTFGTIIIKN